MSFRRRYARFFNPKKSKKDGEGNLKINYSAYRRMIEGQRKMYWQLVLMTGLLKMEVDKFGPEEFHEAYAAWQVLNDDVKGGS